MNYITFFVAGIIIGTVVVLLIGFQRYKTLMAQFKKSISSYQDALTMHKGSHKLMAETTASKQEIVDTLLRINDSLRGERDVLRNALEATKAERKELRALNKELEHDREVHLDMILKHTVRNQELQTGLNELTEIIVRECSSVEVLPQKKWLGRIEELRNTSKK